MLSYNLAISDKLPPELLTRLCLTANIDTPGKMHLNIPQYNMILRQLISTTFEVVFSDVTYIFRALPNAIKHCLHCLE